MITKIIILFFGNTGKQRFNRLCIYSALIFLGIILIQNIGYNKTDGFTWRPAADINVDVKK